MRRPYGTVRPMTDRAQCTATIILDSVNPINQIRLTTLVCEVPRAYQAELNTHGSLAKNSSSVRAMSYDAVIEQVRTRPFIPEFTGEARGMQGSLLAPAELALAEEIWIQSRDRMLQTVEVYRSAGVHRQDALRLLDNWVMSTVVITGDQYGWWGRGNVHGFLQLRGAIGPRDVVNNPVGIHPAARAMQRLAVAIRDAINDSKPVVRDSHSPFHGNPEISAAICARQSYGVPVPREPEMDLRLAARLRREHHASPFEHQAQAMADPGKAGGRFHGWCQRRTQLGF